MKTKELKLLRIKHDYSQSDCAKLLNMTRATYIAREKGKKQFTFDEVLTLLQKWNEVDKVKDLIE